MTIESCYKAIAKDLTSFLVATGSSHELACDIVQDTFVRLMKFGSLPDSEDECRAIAFTCAKNIRIDLCRRQQVGTRVKEKLLLEGGQNPVSMLPGSCSMIPNVVLEESEANRRLRSRLDAVLAKLGADQREVIVLYYIMLLPIREIAKIQGVSENIVRVRMHRARHRLNGMLGHLNDNA